MRQKGIAAADARAVHFGSVHDAFDYQQPPASVRPRNPAPAETSNLQNVIDGFKAHHSVNNSIGDEAIRAVEHALMGATTDNRVCYFCGQQSHIAENCPGRGNNDHNRTHQTDSLTNIKHDTRREYKINTSARHNPGRPRHSHPEAAT